MPRPQTKKRAPLVALEADLIATLEKHGLLARSIRVRHVRPKGSPGMAYGTVVIDTLAVGLPRKEVA